MRVRLSFLGPSNYREVFFVQKFVHTLSSMIMKIENMEEEIMLKAKMFNFLASGKAVATFRMVVILSVLIASLLFTGVVGAEPTPGGCGG